MLVIHLLLFITCPWVKVWLTIEWALVFTRCCCIVLTRDEWKSILHKQVSERRASERKAFEEATKLDNEEFSPVESEAELTDEESLTPGCEKEDVEKAMDEEAGEVSKENIEENEKDESQLGWQSDLNDSFSDDDGTGDDDNEGDNDDDAEGDEDDSDDELIVKNKKSTKQLDSDSDSEMPSQSTQKPSTPVIRNFPFDKEVSIDASELNSTLATKENITCEDGDKKAVDSGLGTSLLVGMCGVDNSMIDGNSSNVDNVALIESVTPKRPSEDDTNLVCIHYILIQCYIFNCCLHCYHAVS